MNATLGEEVSEQMASRVSEQMGGGVCKQVYDGADSSVNDLNLYCVICRCQLW